MIFYTAVGNRVEEDSGRFVVRVGEQEKVLSEMETMLWAALTWSVCEETNVHSQMYRLLCIALGKEKAMEWADEEDFRFCLNRLVRRGLVARCEGETKEEALVFPSSKGSIEANLLFVFLTGCEVLLTVWSLGKGMKVCPCVHFKRPTCLLMKNTMVFTQHLCKMVAIFLIIYAACKQRHKSRSQSAEKQKGEILETGLARSIHADFSFPIIKRNSL